MIIYNEFKNVISQIQKKAEVLTRDEFMKSFKYVVKHDAEEPDLIHASQFFYEFYVNTMFYNAMLNNIASEQSSRMNAMENASKNAGEILDKLTLEYNKARQAKITMELCEIISGAACV
jgi:F-type H+-transporting ATPase subunit gamma